jgi:hypothetical protein
MRRRLLPLAVGEGVGGGIGGAREGIVSDRHGGLAGLDVRVFFRRNGGVPHVEVVFGIRAAGDGHDEGVAPDESLFGGGDADIVRRRAGDAGGCRDIECLFVVEHRLAAFVCSRPPGRRQEAEPDEQEDTCRHSSGSHDRPFSIRSAGGSAAPEQLSTSELSEKAEGASRALE